MMRASWHGAMLSAASRMLCLLAFRRIRLFDALDLIVLDALV